MDCLFRFVIIVLTSTLLLGTSYGQSKFERTVNSSDFQSKEGHSNFNYQALERLLKNQNFKNTPAKSFSPRSLKTLSYKSYSDKSLIINKIIEDDKIVWIEVEPSPSIKKNGDVVVKSYKLLSQFAQELGIKDPNKELKTILISEDKMGESHIKMSQVYKDIPIIHSEIIVHTKEGHPYLINGSLKKIESNIDIYPKLSIEEAEVTALSLSGNNIISKHLLKYVGGDQSVAKLAILVDENGRSKLVYDVTLYPSIAEKWQYIIDAKTGALLDKHHDSCKFHHDIKDQNRHQSLSSGPESTTGQDLFGNNIEVPAYELNGTYYLLNVGEQMFDINRSSLPNDPIGGILTLNAKNTTPQNNDFSVDHITNNSSNWNAPTAVTAHNNATTVYKYYERVFGRNSFDNRGSTVLSFINVAEEDGGGMDNAFWNGNGMYYGNGREAFSRSLAASLDVAAHELSHGVIQYTANLTYQNESGALNESFADIFAVLIERKNYAIGEDVVNTGVFPTGVLRSLSNPNNGGTRLGDRGWQPSHVNEQYFGSEDEGGVHINSGIPNHAFYLFSSDNRVGVNVAEAVYFKALRDYLTASSNFKALRRAIGQSIIDLYGNDVDITAAFNAAFDQVGIEGASPSDPEPDPEVIYEVNPGDDFIIWYKEETQEINIRFVNSGLDRVISNKGLLNNPSISDNGRLLLFIGADRKMYAVIFDWQSQNFAFNEVLVDEREWRNVSISRDGNKIAALLGNLSTGDFDNEILIIDLVSETEKFFTLSNPTTAQGVSTSDVQFADAIKWDHTSEFVMYDASNSVTRLFSDPINYWDIGFIKVWDNSSESFDEGSIFKLFPSLPENVSIGNPSFSNLSSDRIAMDVLDTNEEEVSYTILGVNLETNDQAIIFEGGNVAGYPNYSRTDEEVLFNFNNSGTFGAVPVVATRNIADDGITGIGDATIKVSEATWGTWMSNGQRDLTTATVDIELSESILLYPNPSENAIFLSHDDINCRSCKVEIYNLGGKILQYSNYQNGDMIDVSELQTGLFTLKIIDKEKAYTKTFIKK